MQRQLFFLHLSACKAKHYSVEGVLLKIHTAARDRNQIGVEMGFRVVDIG